MSPSAARPDDEHAALARREGAARSSTETEALARLAELVGIVWRLRDDDGCPWDREQTLASMCGNLVEEVFETSEAVAARDDAHVAEELGDVLMNVLLMARIAEQEGRFDLSRIAAGIATKLVRRHPHVFGGRRADDAGQALASWNESKQAERAGPRQPGALEGVPAALPALLLALRVGEKAAAAGFDWPTAAGALDKLHEELGELRAESARAPRDAGRVEAELGDVLFAAVAVARKHGVDPELALRRTVHVFRQRFAALERALGPRLAELPLAELEQAWRTVAREGAGGG